MEKMKQNSGELENYKETIKLILYLFDKLPFYMNLKIKLPQIYPPKYVKNREN